MRKYKTATAAAAAEDDGKMPRGARERGTKTIRPYADFRMHNSYQKKQTKSNKIKKIKERRQDGRHCRGLWVKSG